MHISNRKGIYELENKQKQLSKSPKFR
jgi:hypothetical protein